MSLLTNQYSNNFQIRQSTPRVARSDISSVLGTSVYHSEVMPAGVTAIPDEYLLGNTITVAPTAVNTTYVLPPAADVINAFGKDPTLGTPKLVAGETVQLKIVNKGTFAAYILSNPTGGDGTALIAYPPGTVSGAITGTTGTAAPAGKITNVFLELTGVSYSTAGTTGTYTIYN